MKKLILLALITVSCTTNEIENQTGCLTQVQAFEHDQTNTVLIYEGALDDFFLLELDRDQQYALIITYCNGDTRKYIIVNK